MTVSTSISFNLTALEVINQALSVLGWLPASDSANPDDAETARVHLNLMLKTMQADGCNIWRQEPESITFAAGTATVTLDPRVIDVIEARLVRATNSEFSLGRWDRGQYITLPNKAQTGTPVAFYFQKNRDAVTMTLWPVPYTEYVVNCTTARVIADVTEVNDDLDVPQEWLECVVWNLADRLAPVFGVTDKAPQIAEKVTQRAAALYSAMRDFDRPSSVFMSR